MEKLTGKDKHIVKVESHSTHKKYDIKINNCKKRTVQKQDVENAFEIERQQHKTILYIYIQTAASKPHRNGKLKIHTRYIHIQKERRIQTLKIATKSQEKKNKRGRKKDYKKKSKTQWQNIHINNYLEYKWIKYLNQKTETG